MSTTPTGLSGSSTPHAHYRKHRLRHFLLPDGKRVHVAHSPEEAHSLRQRLEAIQKDEPFDVAISGSDQHIEALRRAHSHHEGRRQALKDKHGETFDEFEHVREELEALNTELHLLTDQSVALDANFSKYGYSAHLRTYDDATPTGSSASSMYSSEQGEKKDWDAERTTGELIKLYRKPHVKQYFHKGLLWRASGQTEVASYELFFDLLFVGILAINGDHVAEEPTGYELLRFSITFIISWKIWTDLTQLVGVFESDDVAQRVLVLFVMACLLGLTTNMLDALHSTYSMLVAFYLAARLFMAAYYAILIPLIPMVRGVLIVYVVTTLIPSALWIASVHVDMPDRLAPVWIAISLDLLGPVPLILGIRKYAWGDLKGDQKESWLSRTFEFYPALNIEHKVERTNAFVTLVFGYSVVSIIYQSATSFGLNAFFGKAALGLVQAFCFNWIYFELDGAGIYTHAIRRAINSSILWTFMHLPFVMAFTLAGAALSKLVVATDCSDADTDDLTETYIGRSEREIPMGLRWFYCVGLGTALACMAVISATHIHKETSSGRRNLQKRFRLANRLGVCIILICLPLADGLNSLELISVTTCLIVWVLFLELWGVKCPQEALWGDRKACKYTARCRVSKKELHSAVTSGKVINVHTLSNRAEKGYDVNM